MMRTQMAARRRALQPDGSWKHRLGILCHQLVFLRLDHSNLARVAVVTCCNANKES